MLSPHLNHMVAMQLKSPAEKLHGKQGLALWIKEVCLHPMGEEVSSLLLADLEAEEVVSLLLSLLAMKMSKCTSSIA